MPALRVDAQTSRAAAVDQHELAAYNRRRLLPALPEQRPAELLAHDELMSRMERAFLDTARADVQAESATCPTDAEGFLSWFIALKETGPGQGDPLFPWLAERADYESMRWFIAQEVVGEAGFDDLVALTQVKAPIGAKLEMARNYWDEMGHGSSEKMHGQLLEHVTRTFRIPDLQAEPLIPALYLGNLMVGMASNRSYAYHSMGALGVIELTAPGRVAMIARGLARLGLSAEQRRYYELHAFLDPLHARAWVREVLRTVAALGPAWMHAMAEGALMRLRAGARCYEAYRLILGVPES